MGASGQPRTNVFAAIAAVAMVAGAIAAGWFLLGGSRPSNRSLVFVPAHPPSPVAPSAVPAAGAPGAAAPLGVTGSGVIRSLLDDGQADVLILPGDSGPAADLLRQKQQVRDFKRHLAQACRFVTSMCRDSAGRVWIGCIPDSFDDSDGGVVCFDPSQPPDKQWSQYTVSDSLGDNYVYAIAADKQDRIWAGHLRSGVSVLAGPPDPATGRRRWMSYEVAAGLTRPDSRNGPIGERCYHITVSPVDGDVWMATSAGLARFHQADESWSYITRAEGLPSDQCSSMAFDRDGNIYVATDCAGIAIASAADNFHKWRVVTGPDDEPTQASGEGLPGNLTNDVLVARDGTIYLATCAGLAWSGDRGEKWHFVRGADWADKIRGREGGPPEGWLETGRPKLAEDYCTCLCEDINGRIWVGHRSQGIEVVSVGGSAPPAPPIATVPLARITCALAGPEGLNFVGTYGGSVTPVSYPKAAKATVSTAAAYPAGAKTELPDIASVQPSPPSESPIQPTLAFLGDDWMTGGDWMGRYGRIRGILCAANSPGNHNVGSSGDYLVRFAIGPHNKNRDVLRAWVQELRTENPNSLWDPYEGSRREAELDDHGENYKPDWDGPDIWIDVPVPAGVSRVALYFFDQDGRPHAVTRNPRDFLLRGGIVDANAAPATWPSAPTISTRICEFDGGGVYKQFLAVGPARLRFQIQRNGSVNTIVSGVFCDRLTGPREETTAGILQMFGNLTYAPPAIDGAADSATLIGRAIAVWKSQDARLDAGELPSPAQQRVRLLTYRAGAAAGAPPDVLYAWRWSMPLWAPADRAEWSETALRAWAGLLKMNPRVVTALETGVRN